MSGDSGLGAFQISHDKNRLLLARISCSAGFESFLAKKYSSENRVGRSRGRRDDDSGHEAHRRQVHHLRR